MVSFPVAADVRRARAQTVRALRPTLGRVEISALVALGATELAAEWATDRVATLTGTSRVSTAGEDGSEGWRRLRLRGRNTVTRLTDRCEVTELMTRGARVNAALNQRMEAAVDEIHDLSEETLARTDPFTQIPRAARRAAHTVARLLPAPATAPATSTGTRPSTR